MNEHLEPVFKILLPALEEAGIDCWVYGGVGVAAFAGKFIRKNKDVDIFVKETDFGKTKLLLDNLCNKNNYNLKSSISKETGRPKIEDKIFSVIPVYQKVNKVIFKYNKNKLDKLGNQEYPDKILERVERNILNYRFFTPQNKFIKEMFINHIKARPDKNKRDNFKKDARAIFTSEEYEKYMGLNK